jgi:excisionase family DNA binding protein
LLPIDSGQLLRQERSMAISTRNTYAPTRPGQRQRLAAAAATLDTLAHQESLTVTVPDGASLQLPAVAVEALVDILQRLAAGSAVVVSSVNEHVTTGKAATMLGVSRTYVARLLDEGRLPYEYRGTHRRIPVTAVMAYLEDRRQRATEALDDISRLSREAGLYDDDF